MIQSILDTDLYKFSTSYAYFHKFNRAEGTFKFNDRNKEDWRNYPNFMDEMELQIENLSNIRLTNEERDWCVENIDYIPENYWEWLGTFRFKPELIKMWLDDDGVFQCEVTDKLYRVTLYEIAILATYAEVRNRVLGNKINMEKTMLKLEDKISYANMNNLCFSEFGTRRRYCFNVQNEVVKRLKEKCPVCAGTSNVYLAKKYHMRPTGTFPHEWMMFHATVYGYKRANYMGLEDWIDVYEGNLGTALIDTYTTESFLRTLTLQQALLLRGFRQDSGDEFKIGNMIIKRLQELGIDPKTKLLNFSNALTFEKYKEIHDYFNGRIMVSAGVGTNLTCDTDIKDYKPANIVMKLSRARYSSKDPWEKCIKISDDIGKHMGDPKEFDKAMSDLHLSE